MKQKEIAKKSDLIFSYK